MEASKGRFGWDVIQMELTGRTDLRDGGGGVTVTPLLSPGRPRLGPGREAVEIQQVSPCDLRLSDIGQGVVPGWTDARIRRWVSVFLVLGVTLRLLRYGLNFPLWNDEAYLALNILERDFAGLTRPLDYAQVCPLLFLWMEKAVCLAIGFSEWSLRILPAIASIASLFLFRHVAGRLLKGVSLAIAVAILAIGYSPIRYAGEVKPYATDLLASLGLIALAVEWLRSQRAGFLWGLAALGPLAIAISNPAIFVAAGVGLVLAANVVKTRSAGAIAALAVFGLGSLATFLILLRWINGPQSDHVMSWMRLYWANAFPPRSPLAFLGWLASTHTGQMFAYPAGGDHGASTLTTCMCATAIVAYLRRGSKTVLALLLAPFALGLAAAAAERYPYGGTARTMQYLVPSIIVMAGLGTASLLARLPRPRWREGSPGWILSAMLVAGFGLMVWDLVYPCKDAFFLESRDLARRFWADESAGAELLCARTDLGLPLDPLRWQADRAVMYLCHQAIYSPRHAAHDLPRYDRVSESHPLRIVVFNETQAEAAAVSRWLETTARGYRLQTRREHALNAVFRRGKRAATDRYVVYELLPRAANVMSAGLPPRALPQRHTVGG